MASPNKPLLIATVATIVSAILVWTGGGLHPIWWCFWICLLPIFAARGFVPAHWLWRMTLIAFVLGGLNLWHFLFGMVRVPLPICILAVVGPALIMAGAVQGFVLRQSKYGGWLSLLFYPSAFTTWYFLINMDPVNGTFANPAYTQADFLPVVQTLSIAGLAGVTFTLGLFQAATALLLEGGRFRTLSKPGLVGLIGVTVILGWGAFRSSQPLLGPTMSVGLASIDSGLHGATQNVLDYAPRFRGLIDHGARLVLAPEKIATQTSDQLHASEILHDNRALVAFGIERQTGEVKTNEQVIYLPTQTEPLIYRKHHLVQGLEAAETPGNKRLTLLFAGAKLGFEVCKDMDFLPLAREYGRDGVDLLVVPAWDFGVDGWLHSRMAIFRGVENGFSIVRSARDGLMTVTDAHGRVLAQGRSNGPDLLAAVPIKRIPTLYLRFGDWLGILILLIYIMALVLDRFRPDRNNTTA